MKKIAAIAAFLVGAASLRAAVTIDSVSPVVGISTANAMQTGIAIDVQNNIHMSFYDPALQVLRYALLKNGTNAWVVSTISGAGVQVAPQNALALENGLIPHVVFYEINPSSGVRHSRLTGANWLTDSVEDFVGTPPYVSIAVGTDHNPRVAYTYSPSSSTVYAEYTAAWSTFTVLASSYAGPVDLALTSANAPRLVFVSSTAGSGWMVGIADRQGAGFTGTLYDLSGGLNLPIDDGVSLAVDAAGNAHAVFTSSTTVLGGKITHYAVFNSTGGFLSGTPFSNPLDLFVSAPAPVFADIAVDSQNHAAIVVSSGTTALSLIHFNGTAVPTVTSLAVSTNPVGVGVSAALNPLGHLVSGYYQAGSADVRFLTEADRHLPITGSLTDFTPAALPGATLSLAGPVTPTSAVSDAAGLYSFTQLFEGTYQITPTKTGYAFQPVSRTIVLRDPGASNQDFQGGAVSFSTVGNLIDPTKGEFVTFNYSVLPGPTLLKVYTLRGTPVKTLVDRDESAGNHSVLWDGRDESGDIVASGIYSVRFSGDQIKSSGKVAVVK